MHDLQDCLHGVHGVDDLCERFAVGRPVQQSLTASVVALRLVDQLGRELLVVVEGLAVMTVRWQVVDEVQKEPPATLLPERYEVEAFFREVDFDCLAEPVDRCGEAMPSPGSPAPYAAM
jgi:hypothetical protein